MKRIDRYQRFKAQAAHYLAGGCKEAPYAMHPYGVSQPESVGFKSSAGPLSFEYKHLHSAFGQSVSSLNREVQDGLLHLTGACCGLEGVGELGAVNIIWQAWG